MACTNGRSRDAGQIHRRRARAQNPAIASRSNRRWGTPEKADVEDHTGSPATRTDCPTNPRTNRPIRSPAVAACASVEPGKPGPPDLPWPELHRGRVQPPGRPRQQAPPLRPLLLRRALGYTQRFHRLQTPPTGDQLDRGWFMQAIQRRRNASEPNHSFSAISRPRTHPRGHPPPRFGFDFNGRSAAAPGRRRATCISARRNIISRPHELGESAPAPPRARSIGGPPPRESPPCFPRTDRRHPLASLCPVKSSSIRRRYPNNPASAACPRARLCTGATENAPRPGQRAHLITQSITVSSRRYRSRFNGNNGPVNFGNNRA